MIFILAALDEPDDLNNLNQSIWVCLISEIVILDVSPVICIVILAWPFFQSTLHQCYLGCGFNWITLENSLGAEVSSHLHPRIIAGVLSYVLIFYFITWLLKGSLKSHQSSLTIFSSTWCHIKNGKVNKIGTGLIPWLCSPCNLIKFGAITRASSQILMKTEREVGSISGWSAYTKTDAPKEAYMCHVNTKSGQDTNTNKWNKGLKTSENDDSIYCQIHSLVFTGFLNHLETWVRQYTLQY